MDYVDVPLLKLHKSTGQAYLRWQGKMLYFGKYGDEASNKKYWAWRGTLGPGSGGGCTVKELLNRYGISRKWPRAQISRFNNLRDALKKLGDLPSNNYGPMVFKSHRAEVAATGTRSARQVNDLMRLMQRIFKWGVSESLVLYDVWAALKTVDPLKPYEVAHQPKPREAADEGDVIATMPYLSDKVWAMIRLLMLTGARPGEITGIRKSQIDREGPSNTWVYRPGSHKTAHRGKKRWIVFNQEAQEVITAILANDDPSDWLFPSKVLDSHYTETALRQAVGHACIAASVKHWTPYQLRHLKATNVAVEHGLEAAAAVLGHASPKTTEIYQHAPDADTIRRAS